MSKVETATSAMAVQEANIEHLLQRSNVIGVGTGYRVKEGKITDEVCVQVLVRRKLAQSELASQDVVPTKLEGPSGRKARTDVLQVSLEAEQDTGRYRPVPAGCSIGPEARVSAGTLGGWACDNTDDSAILLTNNHVISDLDAMPALLRIVQPGRLDGGLLPGDVIGQLKRHVAVTPWPTRLERFLPRRWSMPPSARLMWIIPMTFGSSTCRSYSRSRLRRLE